MRNERFQLISYVHISAAKAGILLYPAQVNETAGLQWEGTLRGYKLADNLGGQIGIYGLHIPSDSNDFSDFSRNMLENEHDLMNCDFS